MRSLRAAGIAAAAIVMLVLAGCTPVGEPDPESTGDALTLIDYANLARGQTAAAAAYTNQRNIEVENLIAQCMKDEGFDYTPYTYPVMFVLDWEPDRPDDRAWVEQYGYGIVDSANGSYWERNAESQALFASMRPPPGSDDVVPLTEAEENARTLALTGADLSAGEIPVGTIDFSDWENMGCQGWANHEWDQSHNAPVAEFSSLLADIEAVQATANRALDTPEAQALTAAWAACMTDAGYPDFTDPADAVNSFSAATERTPEFPVLDPANAEDAATIAGWAAAEVKQALADLDCRESTGYAQRRAEITADIEAQFIADRRAELDALQAAAEQGFADAEP
jgi:hypothetical protein